MAVTYLGGGQRSWWTTEYDPATTDPVDVAWTMPAGDNTILMVCQTNGPTRTYNGVAATQGPALDAGTIWYWINPAPGSHALYISGGSLNPIVWAAFAGIDVNNPFFDTAGATNTTTASASVSLSCRTGQMAVGFGWAKWNLTGCVLTPGSGYTRPYCSVMGQDQYIDYDYCESIQYQTVTSGTSITCDVSTGVSRSIAISAVTLRQASAGNRVFFVMSKMYEKLEQNIAKRLRAGWKVNRDGLLVPQPSLVTI